jgi:hypothetical protein
MVNVNGQWPSQSMVNNHWSMVNLVNSHWSRFNPVKKAKVEYVGRRHRRRHRHRECGETSQACVGQRSMVNGQRSTQSTKSMVNPEIFKNNLQNH